jgi:class 3 adenylate cyclase
MREAAGALIARWRRRGRELGFGGGIAQGYVTLGQIGFAERSGYTAIGTVCNVAARLCAEAKHRPELVDKRRPLTDQTVTHAMQRLHVELLGRLQLDKAHRGPGRSLGNRFGIEVSFLCALT